MTTTAKVTHAIASLHLPSQVAALISLAKGIVTAMTSKKGSFPRCSPHQMQYLRVHMTQLRHELEEHPARPRYRVTEPGIEYRLKVEAV